MSTPQSPDHQWPQNWADLEIAVLDVETTGLDAANDRIIEIGIVHFRAGEVLDTWGQLIDPQCEVPAEVVELTGIQPEDLQGKPVFADIAPELHRRLQNVGIGAYNLSFDQGFIVAELARCGLQWPAQAPVFDPLIFAREFFKSMRRKNLGAIAAALGVELIEAHRATEDARAAGHVLYAFADRLPEKLQDLQLLQAQWAQAQAQEHRWLSRSASSTTASALGGALGERPAGLGPGYIYGDEADPLRALYASVPKAPEND